MPSTTSRSLVPAKLALGSIAGVAIIAALLLWFFGGDAPEEVSIDGALDQAGATEAPADGDPSQAPASDVDPQGSWNVDTSIREFSFEDSTGTFVGFRIAEELSNIGATEAVGRIPAVTGQLVVEGAAITAASFEADATTLTTDDGRRDNKARGALGVSENPTLSFVLTSPIELGSEPIVDATYTATATGDLTVNGVTNSVEVAIQAVLDASGVLVVTGTFDLQLPDYDVEAPSATIVLSVSETATVEFQLLLSHA